MAEEKKSDKFERIYVIPLRKFWVRVPEYKRSRKAVLAIKQFIAKHMKVPDRNLDKVKLDVYLNNDVWFRGRSKPPSRIKVRAVKEGDVVKVQFAETPQHVKFLKLKHSRRQRKVEENKETKAEEPKEIKEEKTEEQKKDESEKGKAIEQQNIKQAEIQAKAQKQFAKAKEPKIQRMALKK